MTDTITPLPATPEPAKPSKPRNNAAKDLPLRGHFNEATAQIAYEALTTRLGEEFGSDTLIEGLLLRNFAAMEVEMGMQRRAAMTALRLARPAAAREILAPGWNAFAPAAGYDRSNPRSPHAAFLEHEAHPYAEMSDDEAVAAAQAKLSRLGLDDTALEDVARQLLGKQMDQLEQSVFGKQELQNRTVDRIFYLRERRESRVQRDRSPG